MRRWVTIVAIIVTVASMTCDKDARADMPRLSPDTAGGLVSGATVITVTSLSDAGPGTLRDALSRAGPRVILFGISGYVDLVKDLIIRQPNVTIAGQSAPSPGVILRCAGLQVRTHDVVVEHIGVYPGSSGDPKIDYKRDGISVIGIPGKDKDVRDVVLRNVSAGWATDENMSVAGGASRSVWIEHSLIAEGLRHASHPVSLREKSPTGHSMGLLVGPGSREIAIVGNLFVSNGGRNPATSSGTSVVVHNNGFVNTAAISQVTSARDYSGELTLSYTDNVVRPGGDAACDNYMLRISKKDVPKLAGSQIYAAGNVIQQVRGSKCKLGDIQPEIETFRKTTPPIGIGKWSTIAPTALIDNLKGVAGMRPLDRNPIDRRIVDSIDFGAKMIDSPDDVGGWPTIKRTRKNPTYVVGSGSLTSGEVARLSAWLCATSRRVGGSC